MIRFCAVHYLAIAGLFLTVPSLANESMDRVNCKKMQDYYASTISRSDNNKDQYPHDIKQLINAAQCSKQAGNSLLSIEQYKFILGITDTDPYPWSELIYLQLEQVVNTLKSIIRHAPPRNDEERALVSQMIKLNSEIIISAVDLQLNKKGRLIPGSNISIEHDPEHEPPDCYLVMPYQFKSEIINRYDDFLKNGGELIFYRPNFSIVKFDFEKNKLIEDPINLLNI